MTPIGTSSHSLKTRRLNQTVASCGGRAKKCSKPQKSFRRDVENGADLDSETKKKNAVDKRVEPSGSVD